jgi:hypothetical protein
LRGGLGQASDQSLGDNNIGDGPFLFIFHARPAAMKVAHLYQFLAVLATHIL